MASGGVGVVVSESHNCVVVVWARVHFGNPEYRRVSLVDLGLVDGVVSFVRVDIALETLVAVRLSHPLYRKRKLALIDTVVLHVATLPGYTAHISNHIGQGPGDIRPARAGWAVPLKALGFILEVPIAYLAVVAKDHCARSWAAATIPGVALRPRQHPVITTIDNSIGCQGSLPHPSKDATGGL